MKLYILIQDTESGIEFKVGGGSSTKPIPRVYDSRKKAEQGVSRIQSKMGARKFELRIVEFEVKEKENLNGYKDS